MKSLKLASGEVPLSLPDVPDRMALLAAYAENQKKPAILSRLRMAALGLSLPGGHIVLGSRGLLDFGYDLVAFGDYVAKQLKEEPEQIALYSAGEVALIEIFASVSPSQELRDKAANFTEEPAAT